ncbi:MAG: uroporphyrinogen decarboxylase family protein [Candidatus Bathyarchaeia archaeon]
MRGFLEANADRVRAAKAVKPSDGVPVALSMTGHFISGYVGLPQGQLYLDAKTMFNAQSIVKRDFLGLPAFFPDFGVAILPSAFGCRILWKPDDAPWVYPYATEPSLVDKLEVPDPTRDGLMPRAAAFYRYMESRAGAENVDFCSELGPYDAASLIRGDAQILLDAYKEPQLVESLMRKTTRAFVDWFKAKERVTGGLSYVRICDDFIGMLSPQLFESLVLPHYRAVYDAFPKIGHELHCDGALNHLLELLVECGVRVLVNFDPTLDLREAKKRIGDKACLLGNVPPFTVLRESPNQIAETCRRKVEEASAGGGYILSTGGETVRHTPWENILAMIKTAKETADA